LEKKPPQKRGGTLRFFLVIVFIAIVDINVTQGDFNPPRHNNNRNQNEKPLVNHIEFLKKRTTPHPYSGGRRLAITPF